MISLGDRVKDRITGFSGVAISRHEYLNGCARFELQPEELRDGKPVESQVFDEPQLEVIGGNFFEAMAGARTTGAAAMKPGGPQSDAKRPGVPSRR